MRATGRVRRRRERGGRGGGGWDVGGGVDGGLAAGAEVGVGVAVERWRRGNGADRRGRRRDIVGGKGEGGLFGG